MQIYGLFICSLPCSCTSVCSQSQSVWSTSSASSLASDNSWYSRISKQLEQSLAPSKLEYPLCLRLHFPSAHMYPHLLFPGSNPACSMFLSDVFMCPLFQLTLPADLLSPVSLSHSWSALSVPPSTSWHAYFILAFL